MPTATTTKPVNYRPLAPRQAEALTHRARGLSNMETAEAMHCSVNNVTNLLAECFFKLYARNSPEAVAKAVQHGLIQLCLLVTMLISVGPDAQKMIRPRSQRRPSEQITCNRENLA